MNEMQIFENPEFGSIRTVEIDGEPWFVGKDIADILGYEKSRNAIATHIDEDDALKWGVTDSMGRMQDTIVINESGLYALVLGSKLPTARKFKRWVTSEVLPSIRRSGQYIAPAEADGSVIPMMIPDTKDYLTAARLIAHCPKERLRVVLHLLQKGGFDIEVAKVDLLRVNTADMSDRIAETMKVTGYTVYRLAQLINVPEETFRRYYKQERYPRPDKYAEICAKLDSICSLT